MSSGKRLIRTGSRILAITIPYITKEILFPNSKAPMNLEGVFEKSDSILAENIPLPLSSSILSLFELEKAISIPEKKAEKMSVIMTISQLFMFSLRYSNDFTKSAAGSNQSALFAYCLLIHFHYQY